MAFHRITSIIGLTVERTVENTVHRRVLVFALADVASSQKAGARIKTSKRARGVGSIYRARSLRRMGAARYGCGGARRKDFGLGKSFPSGPPV
jgi:hypothetical protein